MLNVGEEEKERAAGDGHGMHTFNYVICGILFKMTILIFN